MENFKAFKSRSISLGALTLLSGLNGVGKSSVLQALGLLRQSKDAGFIREAGLLLNGELVELGLGRDVMHENADPELIKFRVEEDNGRHYSYVVKYSSDRDVLSFLEVPQKETEGTLFTADFQYLRADRVNPAPTYGKSYHAAGARRFMGAKGEYAAQFLSIYQGKLVTEKLRCRLNQGFTIGLLSQVNAWMQELSPGVRVEVYDVENTDFVRLSYSFGRSAGLSSSNPYRPTNVGFGLTYSLPIIVACLSTSEGGLILLENPEAHIHPQGQVALGRLMSLTAATGVQVIVETHSDHILNGIRVAVKEGVLRPDQATVHFFKRDHDTGTAEVDTPRINPQGRLSFWPDGFFDQWDKSLDALLD